MEKERTKKKNISRKVIERERKVYDEIIIVRQRKREKKSIFNWDLPNFDWPHQIFVQFIRFSWEDSKVLREILLLALQNQNFSFFFLLSRIQRVTQLFSDDSHPYVYMQIQRENTLPTIVRLLKLVLTTFEPYPVVSALFIID
jgi:hypothetical protein